MAPPTCHVGLLPLCSPAVTFAQVGFSLRALGRIGAKTSISWFSNWILTRFSDWCRASHEVRQVGGSLWFQHLTDGVSLRVLVTSSLHGNCLKCHILTKHQSQISLDRARAVNSRQLMKLTFSLFYCCFAVSHITIPIYTYSCLLDESNGTTK